jgi:hypothetical protein
MLEGGFRISWRADGSAFGDIGWAALTSLFAAAVGSFGSFGEGPLAEARGSVGVEGESHRSPSLTLGAVGVGLAALAGSAAAARMSIPLAAIPYWFS